MSITAVLSSVSPSSELSVEPEGGLGNAYDTLHHQKSYADDS